MYSKAMDIHKKSLCFDLIFFSSHLEEKTIWVYSTTRKKNTLMTLIIQSLILYMYSENPVLTQVKTFTLEIYMYGFNKLFT